MRCRELVERGTRQADEKPIAKGADFLDNVMPDWIDSINIERLDGQLARQQIEREAQ